jgi:hypothetical protein
VSEIHEPLVLLRSRDEQLLARVRPSKNQRFGIRDGPVMEIETNKLGRERLLADGGSGDDGKN